MAGLQRTRRRPEGVSRPGTAPTSARGSVGSARVWDDVTRARRAAGVPDEEPERAALLTSGNAELEALIAGVVQVTLDTGLGDWDALRRAQLGRELHVRLLSVFGLPGPLALAPAAPGPVAPGPAAPGIEVAPVDPEVEALDVEVAEPAAAPRAPLAPGQAALQRLLEERLVRLGGPVATRADLRRLLFELAQGALVVGDDEPSASGEQLDRLELLQRRAGKLERSLQEARAALAYVSGLTHVDEGLASIYRAVQGLSFDDPRHEQKRSALERIYAANLELQKPA